MPDTPERHRVHARDRAAVVALRALAEHADEDPTGLTFDVVDDDGTTTASVRLEQAPGGGLLISSLTHTAPAEECETAEERAEPRGPPERS